MNRWLVLVGFVGLCLAVGGVGAAGTNPGQWYADLEKPSWTPPNWMFPIAWTTLYILMGTAAWLIWERRRVRDVRVALGIFFGQLILNGLWSWLFFAYHLIGWALVDIVALWGAIVAMLICFAEIRPRAALLIVPYLLWVSYATALNAWIWDANTLLPLS
ncbi:TspO/MBR family protein [Tuwongella immobilis]|uniref:Tryptophan-rich sensory protein n=1 Tax=Tuwongella immobilis TaxID=692036 RepID=A0A6C2YSA5_9BACT|nr:TspO/MBR family protein [Tuwongella immobilis]VIP04013.1 tryptophan-rich sensory protein : Tryptophan-rich sensory protein OS=Xanthomonas sp. Nyagatare GN=NC00_15075 PE=4 SV=1: TspO_MBR [Tuwongella immobilis]VTS05393.1 tryptophan-rich sensory protein : Tryptophan-rich sensory protein OS=Xanthomonas sp. Nyagatare GN=NC00_15075 PE=4 SV=1: TspO_MBR [Tuwongella immobilis]